MGRILVIISFVTCVLLMQVPKVQAQSFSYLPLLRSHGQPPQDFTTDILYKTESLKNGRKGFTKEYLIQSNYFLNEILASGKVMYGDTLTKMINRVADRLLTGEPALRRELRFYTLRSSAPNAICMHQGIIFVTTALISFVHSEDELAYVLSHEIAHYIKHHALNNYKNLKKIKATTTRQYRKQNMDALIQSIYRYNRENEFEADSAGFNLYKKSGYAINASFKSLEMLQTWDHFMSGSWNPGMGSQNLLPSGISADSIFSSEDEGTLNAYVTLYGSTVDKEEDEDSEDYATHPSLESRISRLREIVDTTGDKTGSNETGFTFYRQLAAFDLAYINYLNNEFAKSIYLLDYLGENNISDDWTRLLRMACIYRFESSIDRMADNDDEPLKISSSLNENRVYYYLMNLRVSSNYHSMDSVLTSLWSQTNNFRYKQMASWFTRAKPGKKKSDEQQNSEKGPLKLKYKKSRRFLAYGRQFSNADSVMLLLPGITEVNLLRKKKRNYLDEERALNILYQSYDMASRQLDLTSYILDNRIGKGFSTDAYNRYSLATEWMTERFSWDTANPEMLFTSVNFEVDPVLSKLKHLSYSSYTYEVHRREDVGNMMLASVLLGAWPALPFIGVWYFIPQKDIYIFNMVINIATGQLEVISFEKFNHRFSKDMMNAHAYKAMYHLKKGIQ